MALVDVDTGEYLIEGGIFGKRTSISKANYQNTVCMTWSLV